MSEGDCLVFPITDAAGTEQEMRFIEGAEQKDGTEYKVYIGKVCVGITTIKEDEEFWFD